MDVNQTSGIVSNFSDIKKLEILDYLIEICNKNSNDQILGYKLRIILKCLKEGVKIDEDIIKFIN